MKDLGRGNCPVRLESRDFGVCGEGDQADFGTDTDPALRTRGRWTHLQSWRSHWIAIGGAQAQSFQRVKGASLVIGYCVSSFLLRRAVGQKPQMRNASVRLVGLAFVPVS